MVALIEGLLIVRCALCGSPVMAAIARLAQQGERRRWPNCLIARLLTAGNNLTAVGQGRYRRRCS
jgi:hypothetical protein